MRNNLTIEIIGAAAPCGGPAQDPRPVGDCMSAALDYAVRGWKVFPVWWVENGRCACGEADCQHPGKHPVGKLAPQGRNSATTSPETIRVWWEQCPLANIGIATGPESGLVVVDIDPRHDGDKSLKKLPGLMPLTTTANTGGGGEHIFMAHPANGQKIKSKSELGGFPGIDQKGDGGYIVAPPSTHISGDKYTWKIPPDTPLAKIPDWLMQLLTKDDEPLRGTVALTGETIPDGKRNGTLTSLAGTMRHRGMSQEAIEAALLAENRKCSPPLPETEVLSIARSVSRYAPGGQGGASGGAWPEPEPLRRTLEPGEPFPVEALGMILGEAAKAMHLNIKAPLAVCGQSVLATANLAVQGFADVTIDGRTFPVSEYFLSIALSGDRKTAADRAALVSVDAHQRELNEAYKIELAKYVSESGLWESFRSAALRTKGEEARREAVETLPSPPTAPPIPQLTTQEPTYEGLAKLFDIGWPSVGLFSSEGGRFFGGFAMSQDHRLKTLAGLSEIWDGRPIIRTRSGDKSFTLYGRRLSAHLLMQPVVAETILADPLAHEQGFLSRCHIVAPESMLGEQTYSSQDLTREPAYGRYCTQITTILQTSLPRKTDPVSGQPTNELTPRHLPVAPEAKALWVRFYDWIQEHLRPDGMFRPISSIAAKAAEHALRLAGTLALVDDLNSPAITIQHVKNGIILARFYLTEALRLFHTAKTNPDLVLAEKVLTWLRTRECPDKHLVSLSDVYQMGPNAVRDKATAAKIMQILTDHFWVRPLEGGAEIGGVKRRQAWEVHPNV